MGLGKRRTFGPDRTWTVALAGHRSAGKTSLAEHLLATAGVVRRAGRVEDGNTLLDFEPIERRRHCSLRNAYAWLPWGDEGRIELIDVPGLDSAACDRMHAIAAVDAVVVVVDATAGVQVGTEDVLEQAAQRGTPVIVALTKADRCAEQGADVLDRAIREACEAVGPQAIPLQLPMLGPDGQLCGVIDVLADRALRFADDGSAAWSPEPVVDRASRDLAREIVAEAVAATDDALLEQYLEYFELDDSTVLAGLASAVSRCRITPVLLASGTAGIGGGPLLDAIQALLPPASQVDAQAIDPDGATVLVEPQGPFHARLVSRHRDADGQPYAVFRVQSGTPPRGGSWVHTFHGHRFKARKLYQLRGPRRKVQTEAGPGSLIAVWESVPGAIGDTWGEQSPGNTLSTAQLPQRPLAWTITAVREDDGALELLDRELRALAAEDEGLVLDRSSWPARLAGFTQAHLRRALTLLRERTGLELRHDIAPVAYLETPARPVHGVEGLHVREGSMGLVEEFGACVVDVAPQPAANGNSCTEDLAPDEAEELPARYRPAIKAGIERGLSRGPSGYPVVGARVRLVGGRYDMLSSTEDHFVAAGELAVQRALEACGTSILEPWSEVVVELPADAVGDVISEVHGCRGRIAGVEADDSGSMLRAMAPERELATFGERLSAVTGGRGRFHSRPSHYEPLPRDLAAEMAAKSKAGARKRATGRGRRAC